MNRGSVIATIILSALFFAALTALTVYFDAQHSVWGALNIVVAVDKVLGAWNFVPPAVSWAVAGFVVGGLCYFAVWESANVGQRHRRWVYVLVACLFLATGPLVWPRLEVSLGAPMLWRAAKTAPRAGEERTFANIQFVWAPPGRFVMGSPSNEAGRRNNEQAHVVTIRHGFWIAKYETTQAQWKAVTGNNSSYFNKDDESAPVDSVTLVDCHAFITKLNAHSTRKFRLPTEAEWEYACRAGSHTVYPFGTDASQLGEYAWFQGNSERHPHTVGLKKPNAWGLFDMLGNVLEWCEDRYEFYPKYRVTDPTGPTEGNDRLLRGGSWGSEAIECRSATREISLASYPQNDYHYGFRIVRDPD